MEENNDIIKNFPKGDPFRTPDGFFEKFKEELEANVNKKVNHLSFASKWKQPLKLAASFTLLIGFTYFMVLFVQYTGNRTVSDNQVSTDTLSYEYSFVDEYYTADVITDTLNGENISKDEYVEFLLDNNVSYDLLADYY